MAKINPIFGKFQGKLGGTVFTIRNGEQIMREYNPAPLNPSTAAQVQSRAKLKLLSQLSAVMAPVIAIPRNGAVSSRNLFTKTNYPLTGYSTDTATINLNNVQLTRSVVAFPAVYATRGSDAISAYIANASAVGPIDVSRVVYCLFEKQADSKLRYVTSKVTSVAGTGNTWSVSDLPLISGECVVLAYGVRDNTEAARAAFGNMMAPTAEQVANLVVTRVLTEADVTLTETRGATLAAAQQAKAPEEVEDDVTNVKENARKAK